ncbi:MAG TPA: MOSC domain-containing protein [Stellaceae bacterium]|jgi:hypothetical protein|nr:MOSC domain-containing protein [Stellaceae bacterium]
MTARIAAIYRYPVKGLSPEPLERVRLAVGECLPQDRRFAVALPTTQFDPAFPEWLSKTHFIMLMRDEKLARLHTSFDSASGELTIARPGAVTLRACLTDPAGCRDICDFLGDFLGDSVARPLRVVEAPGHAFADARRKPNATTGQYVSLINLASIASLERVVAAPVDPLRFRANIYFEPAAEWSELDWIGSEITIGGTRLRVVSAITRCAATEVNLDTAERDIPVPAALQRHFGHNLMGVYAEVAVGGDISAGDVLTVRPV